MIPTSNANAGRTTQQIQIQNNQPFKENVIEINCCPSLDALKKKTCVQQWSLKGEMFLRDYFLTHFPFFLYLSVSAAAGDWQRAALLSRRSAIKQKLWQKTKLPFHVCRDGLSRSVEAIVQTVQQRNASSGGRKVSLDIFNPTESSKNNVKETGRHLTNPSAWIF